MGHSPRHIVVIVGPTVKESMARGPIQAKGPLVE